MRATEFILAEAVVGTLRVADIIIPVEQHAIDRVRMRKGSPSDIDIIINKLPNIRKKLNRIDVNKFFWVHDQETNTKIGLKRIRSDNLTFRLDTIVPNPSWDTNIDTIVIR